MAGKRYSRILGSARYHAAINKYIAHLQGTTTRPTRIGQGDPRPASKSLYLTPFGLSLLANQKVHVTASGPSWSTYGNRFAARTVDVAPTNEALILRPADYRAARVTIKTGMSAQAAVKTSAVTGLQYGSYGGKSTSIPFGRKDAADTMVGAFTEIETAIGAGLSGNFNVSLSREKVGTV